MISFNPENIRDRLLECCTLFAFTYGGERFGIDPLRHDLFLIYSKEGQQEAGSIDEVMESPFFRGKSLSEIAGEIHVTEW